MPDYFFPLTVARFFFIYLFSGRIRIKAVWHELENRGARRMMLVNYSCSVVLLFIALYTSWCYTFYPLVYQYYLPIQKLDFDLMNNAGLLLIKLALAALIVSVIWSSFLQSSLPPLKLNMFYKIEMVFLWLIVLLNAGIFIFISSWGTLLLFVTTVLSCFINRQRLKKFLLFRVEPHGKRE